MNFCEIPVNHLGFILVAIFQNLVEIIAFLHFFTKLSMVIQFNKQINFTSGGVIGSFFVCINFRREWWVPLWKTLVSFSLDQLLINQSCMGNRPQ